MQLSDTIKDRNGEDIRVGDWVYFLRGSMAGDNYYETGDEIVEIHPSQRVIKLYGGEHKLWHEVWKEPTV
jgi:hypothetical protein